MFFHGAKKSQNRATVIKMPAYALHTCWLKTKRCNFHVFYFAR